MWGWHKCNLRVPLRTDNATRRLQFASYAMVSWDGVRAYSQGSQGARCRCSGTLRTRTAASWPSRCARRHRRTERRMARVPHDLPHFTIHDLRRSARTHLAALGVRREVAERCLGHKLKGLEGTYDHHDYPSRGAYLGCSQHCYAPFATGGGRMERSTVHQGCCSRARLKAQVS
jgi:hypothetical protein